MRYSALWSVIILAGTVQAAMGQEAHYSQTLDEQLQRVQGGQAPVPAAWEKQPMKTADASMPSSAPETLDSLGGGAIPALPIELQTSGYISYLSGGIGDEDLDELKAKKNDFNFHLLMNAAGGAYVSEVVLRVLDKSGTAVLTVNDAGPYVYANLKPGAYTLKSPLRKARPKP